jgi:hypothetical protein
MDKLLQDLTVTANDYAGRDGFDANFLGQPLPLPGLLVWTPSCCRTRTSRC